MAALELRTPLTREERAEKRKLIARDVVSLASLFAITAVLAVLTYLLVNSFTKHRQELAQRWQKRGQAAIDAGHSAQAAEALRSALLYDPGSRDIEIQLATALAAEGHTDEAIAYFNTLLDAQPGSGLINLDLARLAVRQGNQAAAVLGYQRAIDGTWEGDGYMRRLSVRLELARYLISRHNNLLARTHLMIAAGNSPDEPKIRLEIAGLLEQAQDPRDAFDIYRGVAEQKPALLQALEGAGRTALELGRFMLARDYFARAVQNADFAASADRAAIRSSLAQVQGILALYPGAELSAYARAARILANEELAQQRFTSCAASDAMAAALGELAFKWQQVPADLSPADLERNFPLEQTLMQLTGETEIQTALMCGAPTGDDALLLKLAQTQTAGETQ
jgi:Flp pilus assembly protein TadD